jgi:hypothetical protein
MQDTKHNYDELSTSNQTDNLDVARDFDIFEKRHPKLQYTFSYFTSIVYF